MRPRGIIAAVLALMLTLLTAMPAGAEEPAEVLKEILDKMKSASNASPVVDYVNWDDAFAKLPAQQRQMMHITDPMQMKDFYKKVLQDPAAMVKKQLTDRLESVPVEQRPFMEGQIQRAEAEMQEKQKQIAERIKATDYQIGESKIEGNNATVKLKQTYNKETKEEEVKFVKSGDRWLLQSLGIAD